MAIHGTTYDYSETEYSGCYGVVKIICKKHGAFYKQSYAHISHKQGCPICSRSESNKITKEKFIENAIMVHGNNYDYSEVEYIDTITDVKIFCNGCNTYFYQTPNVHVSKKCGCINCVGNRGYKRTEWLRCASKSTRFDSFKLYKIHCWNETESFYKIGITFLNIKSRFMPSNMPYNYEIIDIIESDDGGYIWDLEKSLHRNHRIYSYIPQTEFGGMYECFSKLL